MPRCHLAARVTVKDLPAHSSPPVRAVSRKRIEVRHKRKGVGSESTEDWFTPLGWGRVVKPPTRDRLSAVVSLTLAKEQRSDGRLASVSISCSDFGVFNCVRHGGGIRHIQHFHADIALGARSCARPSGDGHLQHRRRAR